MESWRYSQFTDKGEHYNIYCSLELVLVIVLLTTEWFKQLLRLLTDVFCTL